MSELGGGRCGRCGAYIHGRAVELNGWWLHEECAETPGHTNGAKPHPYRGNRSQDTCWVGAPTICGRPIDDPIHHGVGSE